MAYFLGPMGDRDALAASVAARAAAAASDFCCCDVVKDGCTSSSTFRDVVLDDGGSRGVDGGVFGGVTKSGIWQQ